MWITRLALSTLTLVTVSGCASQMDTVNHCQVIDCKTYSLPRAHSQGIGGLNERTKSLTIYNNQGRRLGYIK